MSAAGPVSPRFAVLRPDWLLRGYSDRPGVLANWRTGEARPLAAAGAYVARACDGHTDFTSPIFLPKPAWPPGMMIRRWPLRAASVPA